jgi:hypothetical protein
MPLVFQFVAEFILPRSSSNACKSHEFWSVTSERTGGLCCCDFSACSWTLGVLFSLLSSPWAPPLFPAAAATHLQHRTVLSHNLDDTYSPARLRTQNARIYIDATHFSNRARSNIPITVWVPCASFWVETAKSRDHDSVCTLCWLDFHSSGDCSRITTSDGLCLQF